MQTISLEVQLDEEDLKNLIRRYRFAQSDFAQLSALSQVLQPIIQTRAYYVWKQKEAPISYEDYAIVFLSLGDGVDALQEVYLEREAVTEGYMIECLASELLLKAYKECVRQLQAECGKWAEKIDFLGDTYPVELMESFYSDFEGMPIAFNAQYVLQPKKSVVFLLPMLPAQEGKEHAPCHVCGNCKNTDCIFREKSDTESVRTEEDASLRKKPHSGTAVSTYGYQRIFGKKRLMHVYCGDGKGKTTAAAGLALRAAAAGEKVVFAQFMKGGRSGEAEALAQMKSVTVLKSDKQFPFYEQMTDLQKEELQNIHNAILEEIAEKVESGECGLVVLDEITYPCSFGLIDMEKLQSFLQIAKGRAEVVFTGRDPADFLLEQADYITEMKCIRHPFEKGIGAREGIEY